MSNIDRDLHIESAALLRELQAENTQLRAERDTLLAWLKEYGQHPDLCAIWVELDDVTGLVHPIGDCTCGLAALASVPDEERQA